MKNSVSEQNFYIESEEEDEEKELNRDGEGEADVNGTDSDESLADDNRQQSKTGSYNTSWPQSYRCLSFTLLCFALLISCHVQSWTFLMLQFINENMFSGKSDHGITLTGLS
jgi:hypothetical protein